jgi:CMP/dCMP kinase
MIITLAGLSGAGKSTVKKLLAERLGQTSYSMGDMRAAYAQEHGLTTDELNAQDAQDGNIDRLVDAFQTDIGKREDHFVVDGWMSWHFIPQSTKVFLDIDPHEGARRIFAEQQEHPEHRIDERPYQNVVDVQETLRKRVLGNQERWKRWYGVDFLDKSQYDLVIDTTHLTPPEVVERIVSFISSRS